MNNDFEYLRINFGLSVAFFFFFFFQGLPPSGNSRTVNPRALRVKARICNLWEDLLNERDFLQKKSESVGVAYEFLNDNYRNYSKGDSKQEREVKYIWRR